MAFVYRSTDKQNSTRIINPGPGSYLNRNKETHQTRLSSAAPFNNSSNRQIWTKNTLPGPGAYQASSNIIKEKKLVSDNVNDFVVFQTPKQSGAFVSKTMRFQSPPSKNFSNPGPGQYSFETYQICQKYPISREKHLKASRVNRNATGSNSLKNFLKDQSKQNSSALMQEQINVFSKSNRISRQVIGERQAKHDSNKTKSNNSIFFASKVPRQMIKVRPQTILGPGSYNINPINFSNKESKSFKRSVTKSISNEKGRCMGQNMCERFGTGRVNANQINQIDQAGSGSYEIDTKSKSKSSLTKNTKNTKKKSLQCFGSTVDRFQILKGNAQVISPGPAAYQNQRSSEIQYKQPKISSIADKDKQVVSNCSFGKQQRTIFQCKSNTNISPGTYQVYNDFESVIKQNLKKAPIGSFGTTQERFRKTNRNNLPSSEVLTYTKDSREQKQSMSANQTNPHKVFKKIGLKRNKSTTYLKASSSTNLIPKQSEEEKVRPPLCYDSNMNTMGWKYSSKGQTNAPFMSGSHRWTEEFKGSSKQTQNVLRVERKENKPHSASESTVTGRNSKKKGKSVTEMCKSGISMKFTDVRFKYEEERQTGLGPQYYDPSTRISKKSYNVLFEK